MRTHVQVGEVHLSFESSIRCSHGAAPPRRARETPSGACRSLCGTRRAVHGIVGRPSVWFVRDGAVECSQGTHTGTHRVLTRVRCATPPGRGPMARSAAHVCRTTVCTLEWVSGIARRRTWLAVLAGYSTGTPRAEYRAHRSAPVRQHCGCVLSAYAMHCARLRVRSADARADTRADQRRRHQPAHARDDLRPDARAELCRPDG
jgi:hypothetical protein